MVRVLYDDEGTVVYVVWPLIYIYLRPTYTTFLLHVCHIYLKHFSSKSIYVCFA